MSAPFNPSETALAAARELLQMDGVLTTYRCAGKGHGAEEQISAIIDHHFSASLASVEGERDAANKTLEAYRIRARKLYAPENVTSSVAQAERHMRNVDGRLEAALGVLKYFGLEIVHVLEEGVIMLVTAENPDGTKDCAYVRPINGGSYAADQSELALLRKEFDASLNKDVELATLRADLAAAKAERDDLKATLTQVITGNEPGNVGWLSTKNGELVLALLESQKQSAQLRADLAAKVEDSARLDWLALRCFRRPGPASPQIVYAIIDSSVWPASACTPEEKPDKLRAAIDAARASGKGVIP